MQNRFSQKRKSFLYFIGILALSIIFQAQAPSCNPDADGDGILDPQDNCVDVVNPAQLDSDLDGVGDVCDALKSCKALLQAYNVESGSIPESGLYTIDPDGDQGSKVAFEVYCDMKTNGGGWTRGMTMIPTDQSTCNTMDRWKMILNITEAWPSGGEVMSKIFDSSVVSPNGTPVSVLKFTPGPYNSIFRMFSFPNTADGWTYSGSSVFNLAVLVGGSQSNTIWWDWGGVPSRKANYCIGSGHQACVYEGTAHGVCGQVYYNGAWRSSSLGHELYVREP